jgi:hypothetical protein
VPQPRSLVQAPAAGQAAAPVCRHGRLQAALVATVLALASPSASAKPTGPASCPEEVATVAGAEATDLADICAGVAAALDFFAQHGVLPTEPVSIEVTQSMPSEAGATAVGCYIERRRRVFIVPYTRFRQAKTWFGIGIDRSIYRALAAHEAGHAVAACHFKIPNPTIQAKEYLAYVAMFSSMPAELRARALRGTPTEGFDSLDRFTPTLYMFDPMRFGAEAYRHFSGVPDQAALIRAVLAGQLLFD